MPKTFPAIPLRSWAAFPSSQRPCGYAIRTYLPSISYTVAWRSLILGGSAWSVVQVPVELSDAILPAASSLLIPAAGSK